MAQQLGLNLHPLNYISNLTSNWDLKFESGASYILPTTIRHVRGAAISAESWAFLRDTQMTYPVTICLLTCLPFVVTYFLTIVESKVAQWSTKVGKKAPLVPYSIPVVGHALLFAWSLNDLVQQNSYRFSNKYDKYIPVRFRGMMMELCFISGPKNVIAIFKNSRTVSAKASVVIAIDRLFGTPKHLVPFYDADNSGVESTPHPRSNVEPRHRIHHIVHAQVTKYLSGPDLKPMTNRLMDNIGNQLSSSGIGYDWLEMEDLFAFCQVKLLQASLDAMFGPYLTAINPDFVSDYWKFDKYTPSLLKGFPRFMVPWPWNAREKCLKSLKRYHEYVDRLHHLDGGKEYQGLDPFFGTEFIRKRKEAFSKMEIMNADAIASESLAIIWAANSNSIPAAFWFLYEIFRDPIILHRVREEVEAARIPNNDPNAPPKFDTAILGNAPLLQSIYAETLRLRTSILVTRMPEHDDFQLGDWIFPKHDIVAVSSQVAHRDKEVWSSGSATDTHPLEEFWPERFLIYPNIPGSGPLRNAKAQRVAVSKPGLQGSTEEKPKFSVDGLAGAWIPYGGGQTLCPGRHYAKQEMLLTFAIWATVFDIEIMNEVGKQTDADMRYFGLGVLPPKGKTPFRIRRRL